MSEARAITEAERRLLETWERHVRDEFVTRRADSTLETMVADAYVNHVPVMTGGSGRDELERFYARHFIPKMPPDTEIVAVSRTVGAERLVDEMLFRFTHTIEMDWMLPGVAPTGRRVEIALVAIVEFRDGKLAHEHIYWDQASVLVQIGLLDPSGLPVAGVETARKVAEPGRPSNALIAAAARGGGTERGDSVPPGPAAPSARGEPTAGRQRRSDRPATEWRHGDWLLTDDPGRADLEAVRRLLGGTYWAADRTPEAVALTVEHSLCFSLFAGGRQIGLARVLSDRGGTSYLCDVVVDPAERGRGAGRWLVERVLEHPEVRGTRMLLLTRDAQAFYRSLGFETHPFECMVRPV